MSVEVRSEGFDLSEVKTFYGSQYVHPFSNFSGERIPLPSAIQKARDDLAGQQVTLQEAIDKLKLSALSNTSLVKIIVRKGGLLLEIDDKNGRLHFFYLISYE